MRCGLPSPPHTAMRRAGVSSLSHPQVPPGFELSREFEPELRYGRSTQIHSPVPLPTSSLQSSPDANRWQPGSSCSSTNTSRRGRRRSLNITRLTDGRQVRAGLREFRPACSSRCSEPCGVGAGPASAGARDERLILLPADPPLAARANGRCGRPVPSADRAAPLAGGACSRAYVRPAGGRRPA